MRKKCIPSNNDESVCIYCFKHDKLCCRFKPDRAEIEIIKLNTEIKSLKERVSDLENRMDSVENDNRILKKNFLQIQLISDQVILE
jgi:hypothetical protein